MSLILLFRFITVNVLEKGRQFSSPTCISIVNVCHDLKMVTFPAETSLYVSHSETRERKWPKLYVKQHFQSFWFSLEIDGC